LFQNQTKSSDIVQDISNNSYFVAIFSKINTQMTEQRQGTDTTQTSWQIVFNRVLKTSYQVFG
ncbi:hypothetical protein EVA_11686, partial [gut metagenome]